MINLRSIRRCDVCLKVRIDWQGTLILSLTSFLFFLVLAIWAFSQHGTWGLYNWNYDYRRLLNIIIGLGLLVPAVALILWLLRGVVSRTWFKVGSWILNILSVAVIVVCIGIVFYVVVPAYSLLSSTEPILLVEAQHRCLRHTQSVCVFSYGNTNSCECQLGYQRQLATS